MEAMYVVIHTMMGESRARFSCADLYSQIIANFCVLRKVVPGYTTRSCSIRFFSVKLHNPIQCGIILITQPRVICISYYESNAERKTRYGEEKS